MPSDTTKIQTATMSNIQTKSKNKVKGYRVILSDVHTWFGLLLGWLLFTIFLMGTVSYFHNERTAWMQPELAARSQQALLTSSASTHNQYLTYLEDKSDGFAIASAHLQQTQANAKNSFIAKDIDS